MKLYIANTTKQRHIFTFRQLETGRLRQIPIEHGSQMVVLDGSTEEVEAVIPVSYTHLTLPTTSRV